MIEDLKPYPQYKDSGLPWLGQVPAHWTVLRIKTVLQETDRRSREGTETLLSLTRIRGLIPHRDMTKKMHGAKTLVGYKKYRAGQLVMNRMQAWSGMFGANENNGLVSPDYAVFDVLGKHSVQFILERIKSPDLVGQFALESKGIGSGFNRLYTDRFGQIAISLPPPSEQAAIARFLAWATNRLDRAIGAKRRIIALLQEQKQAIIQRAVTRGLDPSVPLKDSGIPWLGEIPEHWEVRRLRHLIKERLTYGANAAAEFSNPDWPRYIRITDFLADGSLKAETFRSLPPAVAADYIVKPGDILFARSGATVGKTFLVKMLTGEACHAGYLIRARPDQTLVHPEYLFAFTQSSAFSSWRDCTFNTATIQNIGADKYANLVVPLPSLPEQVVILRSVAIEQRPILAAISRLESEVTLLREYRTRLIADVVTGKLDVREVAKGLPEEDLQGQPNVAAVYDADEAEDDPASEPIGNSDD
jgi:type I restriction enzyme S subunit